MCGITGWLYTPGAEPAPDALARMAQAIRHRGPDDEGFFRDAASGLALAHRRLRIIDLSSASHQPMVDAAAGVVLAYNGELYNFQALRTEFRIWQAEKWLFFARVQRNYRNLRDHRW